MRDGPTIALGELIDIDSYPTNKFCDFAAQHDIEVRYRYYVIGALGVGKSTAINQFRNLVVLDEWLEQRLPILAKRWDKLTNDEKRTADEWVINQFKMKNDILRNDHEGVFVMDRGPLDPVAFTPDTEWSDKSAQLLSTICPGQAQWQVEDGRVILLQGEGSELALRMVITKREDYMAEDLQRMEERLGKTYGVEGVTRFDTRGLVPSDVARRVAEIIHLEAYAPTCNLHRRLETIKREGFNVNG